MLAVEDVWWIIRLEAGRLAFGFSYAYYWYLSRLKHLICLVAKQARLTGGIALITAGLLLGSYSLLGTWHSERSTLKPTSGHALVNNQPLQDPAPLVSGTPVHISVPSVSIDLHVDPGYYNPADQSWTLSLDNAQYGVMTAKANNKEGDTFIYAHYRFGVFYNLPKIQPGAQAIITTDNGHVFTYSFASSSITTPDDTSIFNYQGKPILVLQTCTGLWYQNRQLFVFNLVSFK